MANSVIAPINTVERFLKNIKGQRKVIKDIDCVLGSTGDFIELLGIDVILCSLRNALMTCKRTYIFDPEYGTSIYKYVFENRMGILKANLTNEINAVISNYHNTAKITFSIDISPKPKAINITFNIDYNGEVSKRVFKLDESMLRAID